MAGIVMRGEADFDIAAIRRVITAAFADVVHSNHQEASLVDELRNNAALTLSLVAECDRQVVGHVAFSPVKIAGELCEWFGLAPLAVLPEYQRRGIGTRLGHAGLESLRRIGAHGCVVLGEPEYYRRFGFFPLNSLFLENVPAQFFLAQPFTDAHPRGKVEYHRAFELCA